jgi:PAS domain-containing protein
MAQREIEIILARQLASYLETPIFIVDPNGRLTYYNEAAEAILGKRFDETGEMMAGEWSTLFRPIDDNGDRLKPDALPLAIALTQRQPAHSDFTIRGMDGVDRHIHVTAFPLIGQANRFLGAIAVFWEVGR